MTVSNRVRTIAAAMLCIGGTALAQPAAQQARDLGRSEFESNCASCHGMQGKGDGVLRPWLTRSAPDLSVLAKNNGGVLPVSRIYAVIEGSDQPTPHGTRDMPAWGFEYRVRAAEHYGDSQYDPATYVRARVLALVDYVARLQVR